MRNSPIVLGTHAPLKTRPLFPFFNSYQPTVIKALALLSSEQIRVFATSLPEFSRGIRLSQIKTYIKEIKTAGELMSQQVDQAEGNEASA